MNRNTPPMSVGQERARIRALRDENNEAIAARDVAGITRLATDDYVMILGGGHILQGAVAYRAYVAKSFGHAKALRFVRTPDRIDIGAPDGTPVAAESGRWVGTDGGALRISGRYLVHWTKHSGDWRIVSETYVTVADEG